MFPRLRERHAQLAGTACPAVNCRCWQSGRALMGNRGYCCSMSRRGSCAADRAEVGRTIRRLKDEGQSIILVEQNLKLALEVADQVVILNTGAPCSRQR